MLISLTSGGGLTHLVHNPLTRACDFVAFREGHSRACVQGSQA